jgi:hypothetical protein
MEVFGMGDDKKIDDELYKKIEWFCDKVDIVTPHQNDYEECMKVVRRMKNVAF